MLLNLSGSEADKGGKCGKKRHGLLVMLADAYFECRDFKRAEPLYKEAIQLRKQFKVLKKSDGSSIGPSNSDESNGIEGKLAYSSSDVEVKYKLHLCYLNMNQVTILYFDESCPKRSLVEFQMNQAVSILQSIPAKQRSRLDQLPL